MKQSQRIRPAFTLVELLVVIAIIAILISILLPVITRARRKVQILASPLVYETFTDNSIHLTDGKFNFDFRIFSEPGSFHDRRAGNVLWSPSGQKMGFELSNWSGSGPQYICIQNPFANDLIKHPQMPGDPRSYFFGWVDDSRFIERGSNKLYVRDATSGTVLKTIDMGGNVASGPLYNLPSDAPAPFISIGFKDGMAGVFLVGNNFRLGKAIWLVPSSGYPRAVNGYRVDVDPTGEWVAFTVQVDARGGAKTAVKRLGDPVAVEPTLISGNGWFATWMGRNELLHMSFDELTVVDRDGNVLRKTRVPEQTANIEASWRKFWHY